MQPVIHELRLALLALQFLTRVPVPAWVGYRDEWLHQCARHFSLVGVLVGAVAALVWQAASWWWPAAIAVLLSRRRRRCCWPMRCRAPCRWPIWH